MATNEYNFSNIKRVETSEISTTEFGRMRFLIVYLDVPLGDSIRVVNLDRSPDAFSVEFTLIANIENYQVRCIINEGETITCEGNATIKRDGDHLVFSIPGYQFNTLPSFAGQLAYVGPFVAWVGTDGKYALGPGNFSKGSTYVYTSCEYGRPGYIEGYSHFSWGVGPIWGLSVGEAEIKASTEWMLGIMATDPYKGGGDTVPGGGSGTFTDTTDIIDFPGLPTLSATDTGFLTMYNPSVSQVKSLANYMWSNSLFDVDTWKKLFQSPMDGILGLNILPVQPVQGATQNVSIGNLATDVAMPLVTSQYVKVSCGGISVPDYFGSFLDTDPYTKMQVFLPYIGTVPVNANDIVGKSIEIQYNVDVLSGALVAFIKCDGTLKYQYSGACASQVPVTASNMSNLLSSTVSLVTSTAGLLAGGLGSVAGAVAGISSLASSAVNAGKQDVQRSGTMAGSPGQLGQQVPILIIARPKQAIPKNQNIYLGYPSFITAKIGDLSGYTEIDVTHVDNIPATENELSEIKSLLQAGVIL